MIKDNWEKIIKEKINDAKQRGVRKRDWVKLSSTWLTSSINYRFELSEIAVFSKIIVMAAIFGPVPGLISDNDFRPMPHEYLAHQACCPLEIFEKVLEKGSQDDSIYENSHGIFLTHFDDYQFTEYDRQKPYREAKKLGKRSHKQCPSCGYKALTAEEYCPECDKKGESTELAKDYTAGKYGHIIKR